MYLLYLDASGVPERNQPANSHYVLVGLAVHVGTWFRLTKLIRKVKRKYTLGDVEDLELHAGWMLRPIPGQSVLGFDELDYFSRRDAALAERKRLREAWTGLPAAQVRKEKKTFRLTEPYVHLTRSERIALVDEALEALGRYRSGSHRHPIALFGEAINKPELPGGIDPVEQAFTQVVSRFDLFLRNQRSGRQRVWGILVSDHDQHRAGALTKLLRRFQVQGTRWGEIERVVESPFFLDSRLNSGVQVVDLCAYALRRYLEKQEEERFRSIFGKFYRTKTGLHGLRHYTKVGCTCIICRERGHDRLHLG
ncbi:MAG: DUF3800 domain-containing protein [Acidobacteriota bacterium]|nr:DUF3800 domain-containing protein [Acidobacteriota bacterium]